MKLNAPHNALTCAIHAARAAGKIMRDNLRAEKKINETTRHDLKIELDVRCQKRIERVLEGSVPDAAILGVSFDFHDKVYVNFVSGAPVLYRSRR